MIDETIGSLRLLHIAAGFVALFVAPGAMSYRTRLNVRQRTRPLAEGEHVTT